MRKQHLATSLNKSQKDEASKKSRNFQRHQYRKPGANFQFIIAKWMNKTGKVAVFEITEFEIGGDKVRNEKVIFELMVNKT